MKRLTGALLALFIMTSFCVGEDAVYLDHVAGLHVTDSTAIIAESPIVFYFNFRIESGDLTGCATGKRIYSPDGATWKPVTQQTNMMLTSFLDGGVFTSYYSADGSGADTIGFGAFSLFLGGVPVGYDGFVSTLETQVYSDDIGKTLCVDSSFYPPGGAWSWSTTAGTGSPSWSGPHCYEILDCCSGMRGDFNYSGGLDILDILAIAVYLFQEGEAPICAAEGNVDGMDTFGFPITSLDINYLVDYLFYSGPPPPNCP